MVGTVEGVRRLGALFATRDFPTLWGAGMFEGIARWTELLVVGVYAHQQTGSPFLVAAMMFANQAPNALFGAFTGALAERFDRRTLLLFGLAFMCVLAITMGMLAWTGALELWHLAIATFLSGTVWTTEYPVRRTLLGDIAGIGRSATAITFDIATGTGLMFAGPIIGGLLMRDVGIQGFYLMSLVCFVVAGLLIARVKFRSEFSGSGHPHLLTVVAEGFRHARHNPPVAGVLVITVLLNFFGYSFISMLPVIGAEKLHLGPALIGILMSMEGAGALVGLTLITIYVDQRIYMRLFVIGTVSLLAAVLVFSTLPWLWPCLLVLFIGGLGEAGFTSMQPTILFIAAPPEMRRRIMGMLVMCIGAGPLGMLHTGAIAEWLGADVAVGVIAIEGLVAISACLWYSPALRARSITPASDDVAA